MNDKDITAYNRSTESLVDRQIAKKEQVKIKMTTYCTGATKIAFIDDCLKRAFTESQLLRRIVQLHYKITEHHKHLKNLEFNEIEKFVLNKLTKK